MAFILPLEITLKTLAICALCLLPLRAVSQAKANGLSINQSITQQAALLLRQNLPEKNNPFPAVIPEILPELEEFLKTSLFQTELFQDQWYDAKVELLKQNRGLDFTASGQLSEYGALFDNEEDFSRLRVGIDMEVLDEGWLKWRKEQEKVKLDQQIHHMKSRIKSRDRNYAYLYNCLIFSFNKSKERNLRSRIIFLESYLDLLYQLYFAHELAFEKIIDQKSRLEEARILLESSQKFNAALEQELGSENIAFLNAEKLPILQIDIDKLLNPEELNSFRDSVAYLENKAIDLKYDQRQDSKLKLFTRYNYGSQFENTRKKTYASIGATFRTPIIFDKKWRENLSHYEKAMVQEKYSEEWYNRVKETMIHFEEYQYKLKQYSNFLHKVFHKEEKLRQERVLLESQRDIHSPMNALKHIDDIRAIQYELLHLKQLLYLNLLQIYLRSHQEEFMDCLVPMNLESGRKKLIAKRALLFEPSAKMESRVEFFINYLIKNEIFTVLMKPNSNSREWENSFRHAGITVHKPSTFLPPTSKTAVNQKSANTYKIDAFGKYQLSHQSDMGKNAPLRLRKVPTEIFTNRNELERWIELEFESNPTETFIFENIERLMDLDQKNLGME